MCVMKKSASAHALRALGSRRGRRRALDVGGSGGVGNIVVGGVGPEDLGLRGARIVDQEELREPRQVLFDVVHLPPLHLEVILVLVTVQYAPLHPPVSPL
jgi:hypothetical protein